MPCHSGAPFTEEMRRQHTPATTAKLREEVLTTCSRECATGDNYCVPRTTEHGPESLAGRQSVPLVPMGWVIYLQSTFLLLIAESPFASQVDPLDPFFQTAVNPFPARGELNFPRNYILVRNGSRTVNRAPPSCAW